MKRVLAVILVGIVTITLVAGCSIMAQSEQPKIQSTFVPEVDIIEPTEINHASVESVLPDSLNQSDKADDIDDEILQNRRDVIQYLSDCGTFFIITANENPNVHRFSFIMEHDGQMLFVTSNQKDIFRDFTENPSVMIIATPDNEDWLKISGKVELCTTKEIKKAALDFMPALYELYSVDDNLFEVFTLTDAVAEYSFKQSSIAATVARKSLN